MNIFIIIITILFITVLLEFTLATFSFWKQSIFWLSVTGAQMEIHSPPDFFHLLLINSIFRVGKFVVNCYLFIATPVNLPRLSIGLSSERSYSPFLLFSLGRQGYPFLLYPYYDSSHRFQYFLPLAYNFCWFHCF